MSSVLKQELKTRHLCLSLAYPAWGRKVAPLANANETVDYWSSQCQSAPPPSERSWSVVTEKNFDADCTTFYVLNSLIQISPNFNETYQNEFQLTGWNQNCDIPIRFQTPACQMSDDRQIVAQSRQKFYNLPS